MNVVYISMIITSFVYSSMNVFLYFSSLSLVHFSLVFLGLLKVDFNERCTNTDPLDLICWFVL